ncbi:hypothetical protein CIPAW_13G175300 [Carya illinoinensis]|uniref:Uncharacterized protein n=1 Tax=Carya illinoinensis TaxID=32201 RepID=A0A8T1NUZ8_CARIL|nr:hypothetical protein CIPAW_13G175300 [Carya illinoinensis]
MATYYNPWTSIYSCNIRSKCLHQSTIDYYRVIKKKDISTLNISLLRNKIEVHLHRPKISGHRYLRSVSYNEPRWQKPPRQIRNKGGRKKEKLRDLKIKNKKKKRKNDVD